MNILVADDHAILRKGLIQILREEFHSASITEANNSLEVHEKIGEKNWDIILMDISMPGRSGIDTLKQLRADGNKTPVLMLSMHPEEQFGIRVLRAGASGFLNKDTAGDELINAVHRVLSGRKYISAALAEKLAEGPANNNQPLYDLLSDRELQVLQLIAAGKPVSDIAEEIHLSVNTISTYRTRILEKLKLGNNAEITRYALDNNLV